MNEHDYEVYPMKIGDTVIFLDGLYFDEKETEYKVLAMDGESVVIEIIGDQQESPISVARIGELYVVSRRSESTDNQKQ